MEVQPASGNNGYRQFNLYRMPSEMWIAVFEAMEHSSDLLKVIQTCRHFYTLAIRVLYRELQWMDPLLYANNARFWESQDEAMTCIPTSLTVAVSLMSPNPFGRFDPGNAIVEPDGSWKVAPMFTHDHHIMPYGAPVRMESKRLFFYASRSMYDAITARISTFTMLRELVFHLADLPDTIFPVIKALPRLQHLAIQYCTLPIVYSEPDKSFSKLPITELTLWSNKGDSDSIPNSNYVYVLYLCTASNLRTLRTDWNAVTARFLSLRNPNAQIPLPSNLVDVMLRFPHGRVWPSEGDETFLKNIHPLSTFLHASPAIKTFTVVNRRTSFDLPPTALQELNSYTGPMATVLSVLQSRPVEHLEITDMDKKSVDHLHILPRIARIRPKLKTLCILMREWDDEILFALAKLFSDLRKIRIKYDSRFPSEQTLLSLGAQFLYRFPRLETFQLYQTSPQGLVAYERTPSPERLALMAISMYPRDPGPSAGSDDEVKELILPWRKHCPYLREVQFVEGFVWRRAFDGDEWCKRPIEPHNKYRELN